METAVSTDVEFGSPAEKHSRAQRFSLVCVFLSDAQCSPHKVQPIQNVGGTFYKMGDRNQGRGRVGRIPETKGQHEMCTFHYSGAHHMKMCSWVAVNVSHGCSPSRFGQWGLSL